MTSTTRRKFISAISAASAATAGLVTFASRTPGFLLETAALGFEKAGAEKQSSAKPGERALVVIQLSGGNDGLNTIIPIADDLYRASRPSLAIDRNAALKIDAQTGFHPSLKGLAKLLEDRKLAILQGVGYPNPNRSHFESMDIWHTARLDLGKREAGWLGRAMDARHADLARAADPPALHLGEEVQPLALAARETATPSIRSFDKFRLETGGDSQRRSAIQAASSVPRTTENNLLKFVQTRATSAWEVSRRIEQAAQEYKTPVKYPPTPLAEKLRHIAQLLDAGLATRIYYVTLDGFDTHSDQAAAHAGLLDQLSGALAAFTEDLHAHGQQDRVLTLVFSEFGRRVRENASRGTDHGAAAPVFLVGSRLKPGLIGRQPSLTDLDDGDLKFHTDFRQVYAALLEKWLGWPAAPILGEGFFPADMLTV